MQGRKLPPQSQKELCQAKEESGETILIKDDELDIHKRGSENRRSWEVIKIWFILLDMYIWTIGTILQLDLAVWYSLYEGLIIQSRIWISWGYYLYKQPKQRKETKAELLDKWNFEGNNRDLKLLKCYAVSLLNTAAVDKRQILKTQWAFSDFSPSPSFLPVLLPWLCGHH